MHKNTGITGALDFLFDYYPMAPVHQAVLFVRFVEHGFDCPCTTELLAITEPEDLAAVHTMLRTLNQGASK